MTYTDKKPTTPGWYWYRERGDDWEKDKEVVQVGIDGSVVRPGNEVEDRVKDMHGQFAGPIPEPVDTVESWPGGSGGFTESIDLGGFEVTHREISPDGKKITFTVSPKQ